jgi:hypothetical protein
MEESLKELQFHESCQTKVLKAFSVFISAYPGFIVFGQTFTRYYPEKSYFKFSPFELYKLYIAIIQILTFFTEENPEKTNGIILKRSKTNKIVYFWSGRRLLIDEEEEKLVTFGIEKENSETLKINMSLSELHNFITALKSTITICLCLNDLDNEIIFALSNLDISILQKLKDYNETKDFVYKFMKEHNYSENQESLIQLILYYFEIIILLNKFSSMCKYEENVLEQILSAK